MRKIIHLDMDCFYAAVEMRERPELANKPIAVGGGGRRSVICTCNYEARTFGVRSGMPGFMARQRCPHLIFLPVRMDLYIVEAARLRALFHEYTSLVEPLALDEAYLDVSHHHRYAWDIAKEIRSRITEITGLTASAGIAPNKMLAKIASDWRKPNGQFVILPERIDAFMKELPVKKIFGVGPKMTRRFEVLGIKSCADLQRLTLFEMSQHFGKWGEELFKLCRGEDHRPVIANRARKSLSNETTFSENLHSLEEALRAIKKLASELLVEWHQKGDERRIKKAFIKIKFADFSRTTKECLCAEPDESVFCALLKEAYQRKNFPIRLLGTGVRFAEEETLQAELF